MKRRSPQTDGRLLSGPCEAEVNMLEVGRFEMDAHSTQRHAYSYRLSRAAMTLTFLGVALLLLITDDFSFASNRIARHLTLTSRKTQEDEMLLALQNKKESEGESTSNSEVKSYTTQDISRTESHFVTKAMQNGQGRPTILMYDGESDIFYVNHPPSDDGSGSYQSRLVEALDLLYDALRNNFPDRIKRGQPPFQMLISATDSPHTDCLLTPDDCITSTFAPILQFGSVPKFEPILPSVIPMPLVNFLPCLIEHRFRHDPHNGCAVLRSLPLHQSGQPYEEILPFDELKPQIIWRGSDHSFIPEFQLRLLRASEMFKLGVLPENTSRAQLVDLLFDRWDMLMPRWRAVAQSLRASLLGEEEGRPNDGWIDAKFFTDNADDSARLVGFTKLGLQVESKSYMNKDQLATYKYHIDIGGGGGTTWDGTLTKLALPGLLFHHSTVTKDYFHDEMIPWEHFVPIKMDLSDLKEKFDWAQANPAEAERISRAATQLVRELVSDKSIEQTYDRAFRQHLGDVLNAYQSEEGETISSIMEQYRSDGLEFQQSSHQ